MRIFIAVRHSIDPQYFYGGLWKANFYPALQRLGHELVESRVDLLPASRFMGVASNFSRQEIELRAGLTSQILDEVRSALRQGPVDLFLSYFYNSHFDPAGFDELRRMGVPSVNFYCNSIHQFDLVSAVAAKADFAWHAERDARPSYLAAGANPIWVQMGADPALCHPVLGKERLKRAVFVGQKYGDRDRWLAALLREDVPVEIYGSGWKAEETKSEAPSLQNHLGRRSFKPGSLPSYAKHVATELSSRGFVRGIQRLRKQVQYRRDAASIADIVRPQLKGKAADISEVLAEYEVCLNFSNVWADGSCSKFVPHVRLRDFEGPMCRTCYLTGHTEEIAEFYRIGQEIDTYASTEELVDKTRYYLKHAAAAEKLRDAGYKRALYGHTWEKRFEELFRKLALDEKTVPVCRTR